MSHLDIAHYFGGKLAERRRGGLILVGGQWVRKTAFPVWRMTEARRRMYTALARLHSPLRSWARPSRHPLCKHRPRRSRSLTGTDRAAASEQINVTRSKDWLPAPKISSPG